jgi:transglutaminase-like putative cysteine protease
MDKNAIFKTSSLVLLTAALVITATWAVSATGWTSGLQSVVWVGIGSIVVGLMLTRSRLPGVVAHLFSLIIGVAWAFWLTARLLPLEYTWLERRADLIYRFNRWYYQAIQGGVSHDNLMFVLQMGVIVWAMGYLTLWFVFRSRRVWPAIIPSGLVLIINLYYAPKDITFWFLIYLLLALLLVIRFNLFNQQVRWRSEGVFFRPDISFDFLRDGLVISALLIGAAWIAPPLTIAAPEMLDEFQGTWHDFQDTWNRLYGNLNYRPSEGAGAFGSSLTLGGPRRLTKEPVMDVKVEGPGRYWRATVYDEYTGQEWYNTDPDSAGFGLGTSPALPAFVARQPVTQTYLFYHDGSVALYALNHPTNLSRAAKVTFNAIPPQYSLSSLWPSWPPTDGPWAEEITYIRSNAAVDSGETYQVVSAVSQATTEQLKQATTAYPIWIKQRYLQLPASVTERTRQLAHEITAPFANSYDKTQAVETYLRAHIKYNDQVAPPANVNPIDYFLFELKEGYCNYYASSMVVLLRIEGIPARLAVGYAQGEYDTERAVYHVLNADAHAWVEVYFPRYGWVEFEPTANQPTIIRPVAPKESNSDSAPLPSEYENENRIPRPDNIPEDIPLGEGGGLPLNIDFSLLGLTFSVPRAAFNTGLSVLGVILLVGLALAGYWWWRQQVEATQNIASLYKNMVRLARWMGAALRPWQTPYEHAALLQNRLPHCRHDVEIITAAYVRQTFGPAAAKSASYETGLAWQRLRPEMLKAAIKRRLPWK